jgi:hypothetical protein
VDSKENEVGDLIVGFVCGVGAVPVYWVFATIGKSMIPAWRENKFAGFVGVVFCISVPLSLIANLHQSNLVGLAIGVAASGIWFYNVTRSKPHDGNN